MTGTVHLDRLEHGIAKVTLDNPGKLNAMHTRMWDQVRDIFQTLSADDAIRCVIITGAGDKAFGAGADISEFEQTRSNAEQARAYGKRTHAALGAILHCRHPVIAEIHGLCVGGGLELAICADMRICGSSSRFAIPPKKLGLVVAYEEMEVLMQLVGYANTLEILFEGRMLDSAHALRIGLVNRVVADEQVARNVLDSARTIAEGAPLVARWHKKFARRLLNPAPLSAEERDESFHCFDTKDFQIGYQAFLAKKKPEFTGQ